MRHNGCMTILQATIWLTSIVDKDIVWPVSVHDYSSSFQMTCTSRLLHNVLVVEEAEHLIGTE